MKTYDQLSDAQKAAALQYHVGELLTAICEGAVRFNDKLNRDNLQKRIDAAFKKADQMQTPWFAHEYILDTCRDDIEGMAQCSAEDSIYSEPGEFVVPLYKLEAVS